MIRELYGIEIKEGLNADRDVNSGSASCIMTVTWI